MIVRYKNKVYQVMEASKDTFCCCNLCDFEEMCNNEFSDVEERPCDGLEWKQYLKEIKEKGVDAMDKLFLKQAQQALEGKYFIKTRLNLLEYSGTIHSVVYWRSKNYMVNVTADKEHTNYRYYFYSKEDIAFLLAHEVCNESKKRMTYIFNSQTAYEQLLDKLKNQEQLVLDKLKNL